MKLESALALPAFLGSLAFLALPLVAPPALAADPPPERDRAVYVEKPKFVVIDEMKAENDRLRDEARRQTKEIQDAIEALRKKAADARRALRPDLATLVKPPSPNAFSIAWHQPPQAQYLTGTCWAFAGTSFAESEVRVRDRGIVKLSEMWSVYWEWIEKAREWARQRGKLDFGQGSQPDAVLRIGARYGYVPLEAYPGVSEAGGRHDHSELDRLVRALLDWCRENEIWDENVVAGLVRDLLDRELGPPPASFVWNDKTYTPESFRDDVVKLNPDDYARFVSTMAAPFWKTTLFDVPDNWRRDASYVNLPLAIFEEALRRGLDRAGGAAVSIDTSEPGMVGAADVALVPSFDIPRDAIDQASREHRLANGETTDDHSVHIVGFVEYEGTPWYLAKDSNRTSRLGSYEGYMMLRRDYVQLKVLSLLIHRQAVAEILETVAARGGP